MIVQMNESVKYIVCESSCRNLSVSLWSLIEFGNWCLMDSAMSQLSVTSAS